LWEEAKESRGWIAVVMTGAGLDDRVAAFTLLGQVDPQDVPRLVTIVADQQYHLHALDAWMAMHRAGWNITVKTRPEGTKGLGSTHAFPELWLSES
jgi:hypothetical protein